jgi:hypothetical protein
MIYMNNTFQMSSSSVSLVITNKRTLNMDFVPPCSYFTFYSKSYPSKDSDYFILAIMKAFVPQLLNKLHTISFNIFTYYNRHP